MGVNGNDNKPAVLRNTYSIGANDFVIKKDVRFTDQQEWINRNELKFVREDN
jgi:hypothetical protein